MKMIAISASSECIKEPRCYFCYAKTRSHKYNGWGITNTLDEIYRKHIKECGVEHDNIYHGGDSVTPLTVCIEYSGYNLGIMDCIYYIKPPFVVKTMTTMPQVVTPIFAGYIASCGIEAVSLSYDNEKVEHPSEWAYKAIILKDAGIPHISCNYLLAPRMSLEIPEVILNEATQINFLSFKPNGKLVEPLLETLQNAIALYQGILPVATDNCLAVQLGNVDSCMAGEEFVHILPDGEVVDCCYEDSCYLWSKK